MYFIKPADRNQFQMMSCMDDLVTEDHPVRLIDAIIDSIVETNPEYFYQQRDSDVGRPKYHPATMLKLYIYGYFNGISSSRKLEAETHRNKELIWLLGGLTPDHWTISNYRKENAKAIKFVTKGIRKFLKDKGYIKLKSVSIDGSKVKAYANREMLSKEKIEKKLEGIGKKIDEYLKKLSDVDRRDDLVDEIEENNDPSSEKIKYIEKIIELEKKVETLKSQREILEQENRNHLAPADRDARLMKSRDGKIPGYNVQSVVDAENKMIADSEVVTDEVDQRLIKQMVESLKEEIGETPKEATADKGYYNLELIEELENENKELTIYVSTPQKPKKEITFEYDESDDEYKCSQGKRLVLFVKNKKRGKSGARANGYRGIECQGCTLMDQCTKSKKGRFVYRYTNQKWRDNYVKKMEQALSRKKLSERKSIVEHPFGTIKIMMGKIPILLRGIEKVTSEVNLYTTAYNLKRLFNIERFEELVAKIKGYNWQIA